MSSGRARSAFSYSTTARSKSSRRSAARPARMLDGVAQPDTPARTSAAPAAATRRRRPVSLLRDNVRSLGDREGEAGVRQADVLAQLAEDERRRAALGIAGDQHAQPERGPVDHQRQAVVLG